MSKKKDFFWIASGVALATIIAVVDLMIPLGVAGGVPYLAVVLLSLMVSGKRYVIIAAVAGSILTIVGLFLSPPPGGSETWKVLTNRGLALFAIWSAAILGYYFKRMEADSLNNNKLNQLLKNVAITSNDAKSLDEKMQECIILVCKVTGWPVGHMYIVDNESSYLTSTGLWYLENSKTFETFKKVTENTKLQMGIGLPGQVWEAGEPVWVADVTKDLNFPRAELAIEIGVRGAFAFPVMAGNKVKAVLEFFSPQIEEPKTILLDVMASIGIQMGRVFERKRVEVEREILGQMKTDFLTTAAHELRTPLTSIRGYSELIRDKENLSNEEIKQFSANINKESVNLAGLINDLLDISKIESGKSSALKIEYGNLVNCLNASIELFKQQDTGHRFPLEIMGDTHDVLMDSGKVQQVLRNLYSNSIKYSEPGCEISTKIEFKDDVVLVSVSDIGKGMTPDQVEHVFDKFYRAEKVENIQGAGLGMGIAEHLIKNHAGRIWVESEIDKGTTVSFELPGFSPIWRDEFSVKIPSIDNQHKELFALTRKLANAIQAGEGQESIGLLLNELVKYAEFHFKYEEDFFHKYDYPETVSHIATHRYFQDSIGGFKFVLESDRQHLPNRVVSFLYNWLTVHILNDDMAYSSFLEEKMSKSKSE
jgi:hemerythrin-like metal-binding protein